EETTEGITAAAEAAMWDEPVEDNSSLFDLPDFEEQQVPVTATDTEMDWDFDDELTRAENSTSYESSSSNGLSFTGLYDKETELGESEYEDEGDSKKRKTSVVICVICAIICIIAVLLILFVIPSKLNVLKRGHQTEEPVAVEAPVEEPEEELVPEEEPEPEPVIETSAKEDEIVIIEEAEEVKPEPPAPPKEEPKPDIIYKIKWGDTLWDIADTYYKNPWRYKKIARYNGIKDPDYIVSGTRIKIPQE
ncbi:MAG: LysM peptidoglycan-binding domain-containing protein, partial [Treponema sp.]|uniref:LysM peptidoglycan-binding domain-containing protein n=1 Tax=Treponema sp. TaxID=166 RepID=UPI00298E235B